MAQGALLATHSLLAVLLLMLVSAAESTRHHYIHWNSSNPIFRIDNTDHIIDVNVGNLPHEVDQANFICPKYRKSVGGGRDGEHEKYVIYSVSKEEYETCRIMGGNPKIVFVCDQPHATKYRTVTFRSFSPTPGGMEFKPGHDYYFISTSSSDDLWLKSGGKCASHNMRLVFKVADNSRTRQDDEKEDTFADPSPPSLSGDYYYPAREVVEELGGNGVDDDDQPFSERRDERDYRNNERGSLIKQEASRMHSSTSSPTSSASRLVEGWRAGLLLILMLSFCRWHRPQRNISL